MKPKVMSLVLVVSLLFSLASIALFPSPAQAATLHAGNMVKNSTAVLAQGASGFDADGVGAPSVIKDGSTYKMWYTGRSGTSGLGTLSIGYTTSSNGTSWATGAAVTFSGTAGTWESRGQGFASVIQESSTSYKMWYTGYSGASGSTVSQIGYATSTNGTSWTRSGSTPVVPVGASGTWEDMGVGVPNVIKDGSTYKMWYTGVKSNLVPAIGYATSGDGITWAKSSLNPVMTGDVGGASVIKDTGTIYRMWYTTRDAIGVLQVGYASSNDGVAWAKSSSPELVATSGVAFEGPGVGGVGSVSVMKDSTTYKMWYTGLSASLLPNIGYATQATSGSNYISIQAAIAAAAASDTIIVHPGTYTSVDGAFSIGSTLTNLTLRSVDIAAMPLISASVSDPAITIAASGVTFKGFILGFALNRGIRLTSTATNAMILYNSLLGTAQFGAGVFNGLVDETTSGTTYAYQNWWGHATGPAGIGGGSGSGLLSSSASYTPWLTQSPLIWLQDKLGYLGTYANLAQGWNLVSTPFALDSSGDTYGEIVALGDGLNIHATSPAYYFDASTSTWTQVISSYVLRPADAIYVRMAAADKVLLLAGTSVAAPSKSLSANSWNLISLAAYEDMQKKADLALASLGTSYSYVVSPSLGNQLGWTLTRGETISSTFTAGATNAGWLRIKEGYWVYMTAAATLGGFTFNPLGNSIPTSW